MLPRASFEPVTPPTRTVNKTPECVRGLRAFRYEDVSADDLLSMRIHDVTLDSVKKMKARRPAFGPVERSESRARMPGRVPVSFSGADASRTRDPSGQHTDDRRTMGLSDLIQRSLGRLGREGLPPLSADLTRLERVFHAPPLTPDLVAAIRLISPQFK